MNDKILFKAHYRLIYTLSQILILDMLILRLNRNIHATKRTLSYVCQYRKVIKLEKRRSFNTTFFFTWTQLFAA